MGEVGAPSPQVALSGLGQSSMAADTAAPNAWPASQFLDFYKQQQQAQQHQQQQHLHQQSAQPTQPQDGQAQGQQYLTSAMAAPHPYAAFWPNQAFMYGAPLAYGGIFPYPQFPASGAGATPQMHMVGPQPQPSSRAVNTLDGPGAVATIQADQPLAGSAPAAGSQSEQEGSSEDCSPSGDLAPAASGLLTSPGMMMPAIAGLPGLSPHEEESRRAQEYWKRAAQPYAIGDTPRLGGPHDEREVKRQRRKQSNRESARRSRLRKQAECETLSQKVDALVEENARLRTLNKHLQEQLDKFISGFGKVDGQPQGPLHMMYHPEAGFVAQPQAGMAAEPPSPLAGLQHTSSHLLHSNSSSLLIGSRPDSDPQHTQQGENPAVAIDQPQSAPLQSLLPEAAQQSSQQPESSPQPPHDSVSQLMPSKAPHHLEESSMPAALADHPSTGSVGMDQLHALPDFGHHQMPAQMDTSQPYMLAPNDHALGNESSAFPAGVGSSPPTAQLQQLGGHS